MTTPAPYAIAPDYAGKFKPSAAKEILAAVLNEKLAGKEFSADLTTQWTKEIADEVKTRLKGRPIEPAPTRGGLTSAPTPPQRARCTTFVMRCLSRRADSPRVLVLCVCVWWLGLCAAVWAARRRAQSRALQVRGAGRNRRAAGRGC